jgi:GTP cyclohydrolase I
MERCACSREFRIKFLTALINNKQQYDNMKQEALGKIVNGFSSMHLNSTSRNDTLIVSTEEKIKEISQHFKQIMLLLGLDLEDESLAGTPDRVAKMYINEMFSGLNPANKPTITLFNNEYNYQEMLIEKNITLYSCCEHHFVPIVGKAHVAYYSSGKIIGLSKINKLVKFYSKRPQVQERLTIQIAEALKEALETEDVAILIDAVHHCVASRGVEDTNSSTVTTHFSGKFLDVDVKNQFLSLIST